MGFAFPYLGIEKFDPHRGMSVLPGDYQAYLGALVRIPGRLWQLANARYLLGPTKALGPLLKQKAFKSVQSFRAYGTPDGGIGVQQAPLEQSSHVLMLNRSALPRAALYYSWEGMEDAAALERLKAPEWNPWQTVLVPASVGSKTNELKTAPVEMAHYDSRTIVMRVRARADGVLLLNDRYDKNWRASVDGARTEVLRCNYIMRGVRVPEGPHEVVFSFRSPYRRMVLIGWGAYVVVAVWAVGRVVARRKREGNGFVSFKS